jgi:hypothetical protein
MAWSLPSTGHCYDRDRAGTRPYSTYLSPSEVHGLAFAGPHLVYLGPPRACQGPGTRDFVTPITPFPGPCSHDVTRLAVAALTPTPAPHQGSRIYQQPDACCSCEALFLASIFVSHWEVGESGNWVPVGKEPLKSFNCQTAPRAADRPAGGWPPAARIVMTP